MTFLVKDVFHIFCVLGIIDSHVPSADKVFKPRRGWILTCGRHHLRHPATTAGRLSAMKAKNGNI